MVGLGSWAGSRMTSGSVVEAREVLEGASSWQLVGSNVLRDLLHLRGDRGGWGACCEGVGRPPSKNWSTVIVFLTTISVSKSSTLVPFDEKSIDSTTTFLSTWTSLFGSSTGICLARPWNTVSTDPSLTCSNEPSLICRGSSLRASPSVNPLGRKTRN